MATVNPKTLLGKLNAPSRRALEAAAGLCLSRTHFNVEIEHWLLKLLEMQDGDLPLVLKHYGIDAGRVTRELTKSLDGLKTGNARVPAFSPEIFDLMREAWTLASLEYGSAQLRSGHLLAAALTDRSLAVRMSNSSPELSRIPPENIRNELPAIAKNSAEEAATAAAGQAAPGPDGGPRPAGDSKTPALDQFTMDLTERARKGHIDPVIGRDFEIRQVVDILTRRRQNNPILVGEAGVGKTAVVEGFALQIVAGDVPPALRNVAVRTLDLGLLQAGAGVKGEFENRLKSVIQEVKGSPKPIILFIDEAHTMIGAGGQAGQGDAANLLKPALARGELRTIAATTYMEYKKYFETDPALKRRFQMVKVDEPDVTKAIRMMRGFSDTLETHHKVRVLDEAVEDAVKLSHRYITDRQLPDKCVSLLDTACAKVAMTLSAEPAAIQDARHEIEALDVEIKSLEREAAVGADHKHRLEEIKEKKATVETKLTGLQKRFDQEKKLATDVLELRQKIEKHVAAAADPKADGKAKLSPEDEAKAREDLAKLEKELAEVQGETPLVQPVVNGQAVAEVVAGWTGVPVGKMVRNEIQAVLTLKDRLEERVIGQSHALDAIAQRIRTARANLTDPRRPIGVFLLVGPSGVGKTETAVALADILFGGDRNMVVINMSEYKEEHKISRLTGSAPGYVGYGEGGVLTEAVRRKPYSVVLLDEVEKAAETVQEIFYQVFDKGMLQDDKGNEVNFKNTIILLTSNVGTDTIMKACVDPAKRPDPAALAEMMRGDLLKSFKPALLGRMNIVPYYPLHDEVLRSIIKLQIGKIADRVKQNYRAAFTYDDAVIESILGRCREVESGARNVDHILTGTLLPELSREFLARLAEGQTVSKAHIGLGDDGRFTYTVE
ncbi:MAG TPA: type VI secretion system ATPase TssH [Gemmataceae bacterium]